MANLQSLVLVKSELVKIGLRPLDIAIGEADVAQDIPRRSWGAAAFIWLDGRNGGQEIVIDHRFLLLYLQAEIPDDVLQGEAPGFVSLPA